MRKGTWKALSIALAFLLFLNACTSPATDPSSDTASASDASTGSTADTISSDTSGSTTGSDTSAATSMDEFSSIGSSASITSGTTTSMPDEPDDPTTAPDPEPVPTPDPEPDPGPEPPRAPIVVKTPVASGRVVYAGDGATIDASNISEGYVMVKCSSPVRLKAQIITPARTYNYDLNGSNRYEVFPLQDGSGQYQVRVMANVSGNRYNELYSAVLSVSLPNSFSPFLYPSQYVSFSSSSSAVDLSYELCRGKYTDLAKIEAIYNYITSHIRYDTAKASSVKSGYLPDPDDTLRTQSGICFDYAALLAAMLRAQGIPTKLVCGTVSPGDLNHAWNLIYTDETGWIAVSLYFSGGNWKLVDTTFAASMGQAIEDYIGNGSNYTGLRIY